MITSDQVGRVLIDGGAAVDAKNKIGQTPLIYACIEQHLDMVKLLLQVEKITFSMTIFMPYLYERERKNCFSIRMLNFVYTVILK